MITIIFLLENLTILWDIIIGLPNIFFKLLINILSGIAPTTLEINEEWIRIFAGTLGSLLFIWFMLGSFLDRRRSLLDIIIDLAHIPIVVNGRLHWFIYDKRDDHGRDLAFLYMCNVGLHFRHVWLGGSMIRGILIPYTGPRNFSPTGVIWIRQTYFYFNPDLVVPCIFPAPNRQIWLYLQQNYNLVITTASPNIRDHIMYIEPNIYNLDEIVIFTPREFYNYARHDVDLI
jgi:hypothetical protein